MNQVIILNLTFLKFLNLCHTFITKSKCHCSRTTFLKKSSSPEKMFLLTLFHNRVATLAVSIYKFTVICLPTSVADTDSNSKTSCQTALILLITNRQSKTIFPNGSFFRDCHCPYLPFFCFY